MCANDWKQTVSELEKETALLFKNCPDEIKRFHYGIITHSDAGKYSLNQYFGHWVHAYAHYMVYAIDISSSVRRLAMYPEYSIEHMKILFSDLFSQSSAFFGEFGGQNIMANSVIMVVESLDSVTTKEEFITLFEALHNQISRLYWWFHWYFPWGIGPAVFQRLTDEDISEINRLSSNKPDNGLPVSR